MKEKKIGKIHLLIIYQKNSQRIENIQKTMRTIESKCEQLFQLLLEKELEIAL
jgi:hypothetical protein